MDHDPAAVLVLAGGQGRRLGAPKAWLPWRGRPLLLEVLERLSALAPGAPIVAARQGQELPTGDYRRVDDWLPDAGPLAGLAAGLAVVATANPDGRVAVAACDYPFADADLFRALASLDREADLVVPRWQGHLHPLHALWRARLGAICAQALARGERRVRAVTDASAAVIVDAHGIGGIDPARALLNLNDRKTLARARALAPDP